MWPNLTALCALVAAPNTYKGICPENLELIIKIGGYLNEETRAELDDFMGKARRMFAPLEDDRAPYDIREGTGTVTIVDLRSV